MATRLPVRKTQKLYIAGAFARSESGRTVPFTVNGLTFQIARGTRKDVRDAVRAARAAWPGWHQRSAYNRGQIIYRLAEMMESRRMQFRDSLRLSGVGARQADREIDTAIDRVVWYAGWCDKIEQVLSTKNPVGPNHFNVSSPEPTGVVGVVAADRPALLAIVSAAVPVVCGGNSAVVIAGAHNPLAAVAFAEAVATCDLPAGVLNMITGLRSEIVLPLAAHMDVNAIDLWLADKDLEERAARAACDNVKRVRRGGEPNERFWFSEAAQSPDWIRAFMEIKTVWHPAGV